MRLFIDFLYFCQPFKGSDMYFSGFLHTFAIHFLEDY